MRRTTICRSDGARLAAAVALLMGAAPLVAQQPTVIQRPIQQAQRAAQQAGQQTAAQQQPSQQPQAPAQRPAAQQPQQPAVRGPMQQPPETHTVQQGETLWSLAQQFLGDPLLWPEIYRLNTNVVEDPHWIFPGEELRLVAPVEQPVAAGAGAPSAGGEPAAPGNVSVTPVAGDSGPAAQAPARPLPGTDAPTIFAARTAHAAAANSLDVQQALAYRAVRAGEYYSSGFLADSRTLEAGMLGGNLEQAAIRRLANRSTTALYSTVTVAPPQGQAYHRGDLLLAYEVGRTIVGYGEVIKPLGLLRVTADGEPGQAVTALVTALYNQLDLGASLLKVDPFAYNSSARSVPVDSGIAGQVVATRRDGELTSVQDVLFISLGADDGVHLGDVFRISSTPDANGLVRDQAEGLVVHLRDKTATLIVLQVSQPDIRPGATARRVRRMPT
jgi:LysM repeat protein